MQASSSRVSEDLLDLNSASLDEIAGMAGIGRELAERIIENRPYRNKLDLLARMVIPEDAYTAIRNRIHVDGGEEAVKVA